MCGISGLVNLGNTEVLSRMTRIQAHRGPDDSGIWDRQFPDGSYIGLGNRRLAIVDLSAAGHMPLSNEDNSLWITFNGEIYNAPDLRRKLLAKGHCFRSATDTEVVVHLFEEYGPDCLKQLNGMFAFAICDLRQAKPSVFIARDPFGIKPFYYANASGGLAFASEVKALLQVPGIEAQIDHDALQQYLSFLWVPDPMTMFRRIRKLPAGYYAIFCDNEFQVRRYWNLSFPPHDYDYPRGEEDLACEIRERFQQCIRSQMLSDVPVGAFLSAGLDSSSVVAAMAKVSGRSIRTYTIAFPEKSRRGENTLDDPQVAARMARFAGCENQRILVEADAAELLPKLVWHMDEPTADPAIVTAYLVCRAARQSSTVLLSGVGGDELFGGYRKYAAHYWAEILSFVPSGIRNSLKSAVQSLPTSRGSRWKGTIRLLKKMLRSADLPAVDRFIMNCTYLDRQHMHTLCTPDVVAEFESSDPAKEHRHAFDSVSSADFLNQMLYVDSKIFMTSLNLTYNDKMSMASSVEVRVPFLDRDFAEFVAWNVDPRDKLRGRIMPTTKHMLRKAMGDLLPKEILHQPKAGFGAPVDHWLAHDLRHMVDDLLSESNVNARGLFRSSAVQNLISQHRKGIQDYSMQIWQLLTLELWMQTFLDKSVATPAGESSSAVMQVSVA